MELKRYKLSEVAKVDISSVDKKTKDGETPVRLCNFTDVYHKWAITSDIADTFMEASANSNEIEKFTIKKGQVAFTKDSETRDDIGIPTYIADDFDDVILGYHCALITPDETKLCGKYLNAFMHSAYIQRYFELNATGSGMRYTLSLDTLESMPLLLPSLEEQKRIGEIFSAIDKKISINRAINQNLEALAKQLYDYWFVQFDFPDEEGKPYKSSGGAMMYSNILRRNIPLNWEVEELGNTCEILLGGTPDTGNELYWGGSYSWLNSGEVAEFPILKSEKTITEEGLNSSATAYAPKGSVTLSITRHLRPSILAIDACINQSVVAIKETENLRKEYLYPLINREIPRYMTLRTGAQQPHINKETVESTWIIIPPTGILDKYYMTVSSIYRSIIENAIEIENLTKQRDELLPLLMNGQVSLNSDLSSFLLYYRVPNKSENNEREHHSGDSYGNAA